MAKEGNSGYTRRDILKLLGLAAAMPSGQANASPNMPEKSLCSTIADSDALDFLEKYKDTIAREAEDNGLPKEFVASVIYAEKSATSGFSERMGDWVNSIFNADGTYGPCQVKLSTALFLDGKIKTMEEMDKISDDVKKEYIKKLYDPAAGINYASRYLAYLKNRKNRYPSLAKDELLQNPRAMAILATEYNLGEKNSAADEARFSYYGYNVIIGLSSCSDIEDVFKIDAKTKYLCDKFLAENREWIEGMVKKGEPDKKPKKYRKAMIVGEAIVISGIALAAGAYYALRHFARKAANEGRKEMKNSLKSGYF